VWIDARVGDTVIVSIDGTTITQETIKSIHCESFGKDQREALKKFGDSFKTVNSDKWIDGLDNRWVDCTAKGRPLVVVHVILHVDKVL
jgi:hypothetical protein